MLPHHSQLHNTAGHRDYARTSDGIDIGWLSQAFPVTPPYLAGVKDIYTCELVGYAMDKMMTTDLVASAIRQAVRNKRPEPGLIHHSDRGSQYCAHDLPSG